LLDENLIKIRTLLSPGNGDLNLRIFGHTAIKWNDVGRCDSCVIEVDAQDGKNSRLHQRQVVVDKRRNQRCAATTAPLSRRCLTTSPSARSTKKTSPFCRYASFEMEAELHC